MLENSKKQITEIIWTKEYDEFKLYDKNRNVDFNFVHGRITNSLKEHGWLPTHPLIVDKDFQIRDGQHRFIAAKELGIEIPVLFVDNFDDTQMISVNCATKRWTDKDFLLHRAKNGDESAAKLCRLIDKYKVGVRQAMLAAGVTQFGYTSSMPLPDFSLIAAEQNLDKVMELVELLKRSIKKRTDRLVTALLQIIRNSQYDHQRMTQKLKDQQDRIHHCNSLDNWKAMLEDIYNYRMSNKLFFTRSI